jgi:hypothetical protein
VFYHHYYDAVTQVKCSLSKSDGDLNQFLTSWWFIPHTNHTHPLKWSTDHQLHYPGKCCRTNWSRSTQGPPDSQDAPWAHSSRPRHTRCSINTRTRVDPDPNNATSFADEGTLFGQLNVRHTLNMTRGTCNDRSLTDTDEKLIAP